MSGLSPRSYRVGIVPLALSPDFWAVAIPGPQLSKPPLPACEANRRLFVCQQHDLGVEEHVEKAGMLDFCWGHLRLLAGKVPFDLVKRYARTPMET